MVKATEELIRDDRGTSTTKLFAAIVLVRPIG